jgi:hypothetical protein
LWELGEAVTDKPKALILVIGGSPAAHRIFCEEYWRLMFEFDVEVLDAGKRTELGTELGNLITAQQFPKEFKQPDRSKIQNRWGRYK